LKVEPTMLPIHPNLPPLSAHLEPATAPERTFQVVVDEKALRSWLRGESAFDPPAPAPKSKPRSSP
jgi:hypothetical protein